MRMPPLRCLPILPLLLHDVCSITSSLESLGPALQVCLTFRLFPMLRQSNLTPPSASQFDPTRHTCRGDIFMAPPGLQILVSGRRPTSRLIEHQCSPSQKCRDTHRPDRHLLFPPHLFTYHLSGSASPHLLASEALHHSHSLHPVLSPVCVLHALGFNASLFSLLSLCRGWARAVYRQGLDQIDIKRQRLWT